MSTLQRQIAEKFLEKLSTSKDIDSEKIVQLKMRSAGLVTSKTSIALS